MFINNNKIITVCLKVCQLILRGFDWFYSFVKTHWKFWQNVKKFVKKSQKIPSELNFLIKLFELSCCFVKTIQNNSKCFAFGNLFWQNTGNVLAKLFQNFEFCQANCQLFSGRNAWQNGPVWKYKSILGYWNLLKLSFDLMFG